MQPNIRVMLFDEDGERFSVRDRAVCCMPSKKPALFVPPPYPWDLPTPKRSA